jgi:GNAT superfamily N-acetyltransferase
VRIERAAWDAPDARRLRAAHQAELVTRYGADAEPGGKPSADDVLVTLLARDEDGTAIGCGALRALEPGVVELKRMWVTPAARGRGVARRLLAALEEDARVRGFAFVRLETGDRQPDAIALYVRAGYVPVPCWGAYAGAAHSCCYQKRLD